MYRFGSIEIELWWPSYCVVVVENFGGVASCTTFTASLAFTKPPLRLLLGVFGRGLSEVRLYSIFINDVQTLDSSFSSHSYGYAHLHPMSY